MELTYCRSWSENVEKFCFSNCIMMGELVNFILSYLQIGLSENPVRKYLFIGANFIIFSMCFIACVRACKSTKIMKKSVILLTIFVGFYIISFGNSLARFGITSELVSCLSQTVIISGTCFLASLIGALKEYRAEFLKWIEKGSFIAFPMAAYYCFVHLFSVANQEWNYGANVGIMDYMYLAYTFMPYMIAHMLSFIFEKEREIELFSIKIKHSQGIRVVVSTIYWIAILASGTRGACLSSVVAFLTISTVTIGCKKKIVNRKTLLLPLGLLALFLFFGGVWRPEGMNRMERWGLVIEGISQGELRTGKEHAFSSTEQIVDYSEQVEEEFEAEEHETISLDREELYKLALLEFKKSPFIGIGPLKYSLKYKQYPHNLELELLAETGILGTILYLGVVLYILSQWIVRKKKDQSEIVLILFLVAYMVQYNISGSIWRSFGALFFAVALGAITIAEKQ